MSFPTFNETNGNIHITLNLSSLDKKFKRAQFALDSQVMTDMVPMMPMQTGGFIQRTRAMSATWAGTGKVCAAAPPYGRYLYYGKTMVDSVTGKGPAYIPGVGYRFRRGAKLRATDRNLTYSNPDAKPFWFEEAKKLHAKEWVQLAQKVVDGHA